jgi:DNA-binding transcriptional MerR regulator
MNEIHEPAWKLAELAQQAGVSARTVRYYVQRGLLPAPVFRGRDTVYSNEHLLKLKAIRRLQERFLPLDAIHRELARCSHAELCALITAQDEGPPAPAPERQFRPPLPDPLPAQTAASPHRVSEHWQRWILAPGLELHLAESADAATRQQAEALLSAFMKRGG